MLSRNVGVDLLLEDLAASPPLYELRQNDQILYCMSATNTTEMIVQRAKERRRGANIRSLTEEAQV